MRVRKPHRNDEGDDWLLEVTLANPGSIGSVSPLSEAPPEEPKRYRRAIGFLANIDELLELED